MSAHFFGRLEGSWYRRVGRIAYFLRESKPRVDLLSAAVRRRALPMSSSMHVPLDPRSKRMVVTTEEDRCRSQKTRRQQAFPVPY